MEYSFSSRLCLTLSVIVILCSVSLLDAEELPNILVIVTDDQRFDDLDDFMPMTKRYVFDTGIRFHRGYVTTPACCPSRSSILTGLYASEHRVTGNKYKLKQKTFVERVRDGGSYFTGIIGKYLNTSSGNPRPEFDYWVSFRGGSISYNDPYLNVNGKWRYVSGYSTYLFRDFALDFFDRALESGKPFLCLLSFNAPHYPLIPHPGDIELYNDLPSERPPSFNEEDRTDKPRWVQSIPLKSPRDIKGLDSFRLRQRQALASVDRSIGVLFERMDELGVLENTAIFFLSDNGVMSGEHGLSSKDTVYEEAIRVPFAFRYPEKVSPGESTALVANIDIAPTILELAGEKIPKQMSGRSLLQLIDSPDLWRKELLIEGFRNRGNRVPFSAVHTGRYVYVRNGVKNTIFDKNRTELYDLESDPYQLNNRTNSKLYSDVETDLRSRLRGLLKKHRGYTSLRRPEGERKG